MDRVYSTVIFLARIVSFKEWHLKADTLIRALHSLIITKTTQLQHKEGKIDDRRATLRRLMSGHIETEPCQRPLWKLNILLTLDVLLTETPESFPSLTFDNFGNSNGHRIC